MSESGGMNNLKVGSQKAVLGGVLAFVIAFAGSLQVAISSGADLSNWQVWLNVLLVAIVGGGATSGGVYGITNKIKGS